MAEEADETLRRLNRELQAISNCNQALLRATDEQTLLDDICRIVCNEAGYRMAWAGFAENDEAKTVRPVAWAGIEDGYLAIANFSWGDTERGCDPVGGVIRSGETIYVQDFATDPGVAPWREDALQRGYRSKIALPLKDENAHTFGVLCIYCAEPNFFKPDEQRLLEELAGDLAFGVITLRIRAARKQAEEEIRRHTARMEALAEISRAFVEVGLDYQRVLNTVARRTAEFIGDSCVITLFSDDRQRSFPVAFYHPDPKARSLMQDALLHTWQGGTDTERFHMLLSGESMYIPVVIPEEYRAATEPEFWPYVDHVGVSSVLVVPLRVQDRVIGTLGITRDQHGSAYTRDDQVLLQDLADRAALTIQNARLFEQVQGAHERLQELSRQVLQAQEVERRAIARELHDEIGQVLNAVSANLQAIQLSSDAATLAERLKESVDLVDEALRQIRALSLDLRPSMLDDFGLVPALEWFVDRQAQRSGFSAEWVVEPSDLRMPANLETTVFRVAQIALTNVARHAQAKHVQVELRQHEAESELVIRDDGIGFDVRAALERASRGATLGLLSMQERVRLVSGALEMTSTPGLGTEIRVRFPAGRKDMA